MMKLANASLALSTATFGLMLGLAQNAQAASFVVPNVTATANIAGNTTYSLANIVNGQGLPSNQPSLTGNHATSSITNSWRSVLGFLTAAKPIQITFDFGVARNLTGLSFWNATGGDAPFGVRNVTFQYKQGTNWINLTTTSPWTGAFTQGGAAPQLVNFSQVQTTGVRFNITSNYGGDRVAMNEVQFKAVPEPSASLALLALGLAGIGLGKRI